MRGLLLKIATDEKEFLFSRFLKDFFNTNLLLDN